MLIKLDNIEHDESNHSTIKPLAKYKHRIIIAGSREFYDYKLFSEVVTKYLKDKELDLKTTLIISGGAKSGADALAIQYAIEKEIDYIIFNAKWDELGKSAGYIRNAEMSKFANALVAFWDGESKGTKNMIDISAKADLSTRVYVVKKYEDA